MDAFPFLLSYSSISRHLSSHPSIHPSIHHNHLFGHQSYPLQHVFFNPSFPKTTYPFLPQRAIIPTKKHSSLSSLCQHVMIDAYQSTYLPHSSPQSTRKRSLLPFLLKEKKKKGKKRSSRRLHAFRIPTPSILLAR